MSRRRKATTSNELIRENCEWPMTVGEVAKLTGVTPRALQIYDERGLLCPTRSGEGVANNRKLYMPEDIDRLKQIVVLKDYGFDLKEMAPILDGEVDVLEALDERLKELQAEENYLKSLILFARYAQVVGEDIFETLAFGTSEVDAFAEFLRESPSIMTGNSVGRTSTMQVSNACGMTSVQLFYAFSLLPATTRSSKLKRPSHNFGHGSARTISRSTT